MSASPKSAARSARSRGKEVSWDTPGEKRVAQPKSAPRVGKTPRVKRVRQQREEKRVALSVRRERKSPELTGGCAEKVCPWGGWGAAPRMA